MYLCSKGKTDKKDFQEAKGVDARRLVRDENFKFMPKEALAIREKSIEK